MRLSKLWPIAGVALLALAAWWAFEQNKIDLWEAISPAYLATIDEDLSHLNEITRPVAFCFELHRDGAIQIAEACKSFLSHHPRQAICAIQNLDRGNWDADIAESNATAAASAIRVLAENLQCQTVVLDFESVTNRDLFTSWVRTLTSELKAQGLKTSIAVHAKTDANGSWIGATAQDWPALCQASDELLLMAYDFHVPGLTPPGEQAPLNWVEQVLKYARTTCPASHIRLGLAAYGHHRPNNAIVTERELHAASDSLPSAPSFVETTKAREQKIQLAKSVGVHKFFIWAMGMMPTQ